MRSRTRDGGLVRITGYTYRADTYCPSCMGNFLMGKRDLTIWQVEEALDRMAYTLGVSREDEATFDSDHFPKVVLSLEDDGVTCGQCGGPFE